MRPTCGTCLKFVSNQGSCRRSSNPDTHPEDIDDEISPMGGGCDEWVQAGPLDKYPSDIILLANKLLDEGDVVKFILDTWNKRHVGDRVVGETFLCATACLMLVNSAGLHEKLSGPSGTGKSSAAKKFIFLLPEVMKMCGSLSGKAAFYDEKLTTGTIIFTDDTNINEDIVTTIKQATTNFQSATLHRTVDTKRKHTTMDIPARISWWLTTVDAFVDSQMGNRFITQDVESSDEHKIEIFKKQKELELLGITEITIDDTVLICRAIFDILYEKTYEIIVPYVNAIEWNNKENSRNFPMFLDIIRSLALYRIRRLKCIDGRYLADIDDYYHAKKIYNNLADTHNSNLGKDELRVMRFMTTSGILDRNSLMDKMECSYNHIKNLMHGKNGDGGLLHKVEGLKYDEENITHGDGVRTSSKKFNYIFKNDNGKFGLGSWGNVVDINIEQANEEIEKYILAHDCTTFAQRLHNDCTSVYNTNMIPIDILISKYCTKEEEYIIKSQKPDINICASIPENPCKRSTDSEDACARAVQAVQPQTTDTENTVQTLTEGTTELSQRDKIAKIRFIIHNLESANKGLASTIKVYYYSSIEGIDEGDCLNCIKKMKTEGAIFEPKEGYLKCT